MIRVFPRSRIQPRKKIFYGWWIVVAGSISQGYTSGAFWQGFGAFFDAIVEQFGWSRAVTSAAVSIQRTESGMISPFVGWFIDRFGPRNVMLVGILATGVGFIFLSHFFVDQWGDAAKLAEQNEIAATKLAESLYECGNKLVACEGRCKQEALEDMKRGNLGWKCGEDICRKQGWTPPSDWMTPEEVESYQ